MENKTYVIHIKEEISRRSDIIREDNAENRGLSNCPREGELVGEENSYQKRHRLGQI